MNSSNIQNSKNLNETNQSLNMSIDDIDLSNLTKIKLDNILENLKNLKIDSNTVDELRGAIKLLKRFKLLESTKWCCELLNSISKTSNINDSNIIQGKNLTNIFNKTLNPQSNSNLSSNFTIGNKYTILYQKYKNNEDKIKDILSYANCLFDLREYLKCYNVISNYATNDFPTAMFLYYNCQYMIIQQKMQEEKLDNSDNLNYKYSSSIELNKLQNELSQKEENFSPFMNYLYGIILKDLKRYNESKNYFIKCLNDFPYLWSCWLELCSILKIIDYNSIFSEINEHWMKYFYLSNYLTEKNNETESITILNNLIPNFQNSIFIINSLAISYYQLHEYETSLEYFEKLFQIDPHRYESCDIYSHILFIKENYCELSNLAYKCYQNDKYRPETCCVIGNYYALKGEHPKAVSFFKRAVKLDNSFLYAWTLMGHEYLEMKIISAAVESYRTAVDIDKNDYRAWYGLGQTYEIHQMYNFAIYYFIHAAKAKPNDSRMWTAIGLCYEKIDKKKEAIKCYEKAIQFKDKEGIALFKMAKLYSSLNDDDKAAVCFKQNLGRNVGDGNIDSEEMVESCLFLARYYKGRGQYEEAFNILVKLKDYEGTEKDEIQKLLRQLSMN